MTPEQRRQMDIDWLWWVFMAAGASIEWLAKELNKRPEQVRAMLDRIITGQVEINLVENNPHLDRCAWTSRQQKILLRMREAGLSPTETGRLLSRSTSLVKFKLKSISNVTVRERV